MKTYKILLAFIAAAGIMLSGCDDILSDLLKFDGEWYSMEFTIEPSDTVGDLEFITEEFEVNLDSLLDANGILPENLKSAKVSDARVIILTEGKTFDPVTNVEFLMESPNLGSTRVAWLDPVPRGLDTVNLELNKDDLQEYLHEDKFKFTANGSLISTVDDKLDLVAEIRFVFRGDFTQ